MSNEGGDDEPKGEFDRMSLNSLKRELEVQKTKTELAREEARGRIAETTKKKTPWGMILGIAAVSLLLVGGGLMYARSFIPRDYLPAFALPDLPDSGTFVLPNPDDYAPRDAGPPAQEPTKHRPRPQKNPADELDFGDDDRDPLRGL